MILGAIAFMQKPAFLAELIKRKRPAPEVKGPF
jgi:hypothetical protein